MVLANRILLFLLQRLPYTIAKNWDDYPIPYIQFESITETEHPQAGQSSPCFESSRFVALIPRPSPSFSSDYTEELLVGKFQSP